VGVIALVLALGVAACGSSGSSGNGVASKSPAQILTAVAKAVDGVKSVHVSGSTDTNGTPVTLDLSLRAGSGGKGTMAENGLSFQLVVVGGKVYLYGSEAFWRHVANANAAALFKGKWLVAPASGQFAQIVPLTNVSQLFKQLLASHGPLRKSGTSTVNGTKVVGLRDKSNGATLYVAANGPPYPIEIVQPGTRGGHFTFDRYNAPVTVTAPAHTIILPTGS
jgi:hypothetical protein